MRVSIVTPSYNQAAFLEQTIESVLNQNYPDIEYMIIDGGSSDGSVEIIRKYEAKLAYWQSRADRGYADAVNQGWKRSSGDILAYLNSDDLLEPTAVETIVQAFRQRGAADVVYGDAQSVDERGRFLQMLPASVFQANHFFRTWQNFIWQPSAFIHRRVREKYGDLDDTFQFAADLEYWLRIAADAVFVHLPVLLSKAREHAAAKSSAQQQVLADELLRLFEKFRKSPIFENSGVPESDALRGLYRRVSEIYLRAGDKSEALRAHVKYTGYTYSGAERVYRILRFIVRLLFRS